MKLAVFDFDGTLYPQDTLPFLLKQWRVLKYPRMRMLAVYLSVAGLYARYKLGLFKSMSREQIKREAMRRFNRIFAGMSIEAVGAFFRQCAVPIATHLNDTVAQEVVRVKNLGYHTVLLSGCYHRLLKYICTHIAFDTVIGTEMHFADGIVDLDMPLDIITGDVKVRKIKEAFDGQDVDWLKSCAYADSLSDMPILELVGHPVAVAPDPGLKPVAAERKWRVIQAAQKL